MGDRHSLLSGQPFAQPLGDLVDGRQFPRLRLLPLLRPPLHLPLDVAIPLGEIAETDLIDVDRMKVCKHVEQVLTDVPAQVERQVRRPLGAVEDLPVDVAHHVERGARDRAVGAQAQRRRHGHPGAAHRRDDSMFPGHVVRGRQHLGQGRPAQHIARAIAVGDREGQVGAAAHDQRELIWPTGTGDVGVEPGSDSGGVDALHRATP